MRVPTVIAALLASGALLSSCGGDDAEQAAATAESEATQAAEEAGATLPSGAIAVDLDEWSVKPSAGSAEAGKVVFAARNVGQAPHELEVIDTDTPAGDFPVDAGRAEVDGREVGEVTDIGGGQTKLLEVDLEPGHYALICNLPGHYEPGMHADFEVK